MKWVALALLFVGPGAACTDCGAVCTDTMAIYLDVAADETALLGDTITICKNDACVAGAVEPSQFGDVELTGPFFADMIFEGGSMIQIGVQDAGPYVAGDVYSVDIADGSATIFEGGGIAMYRHQTDCGDGCTVGSLQL